MSVMLGSFTTKCLEINMGDYIAVRMAQAFIVVVFLMGVVGFVQDFIL